MGCCPKADTTYYPSRTTVYINLQLTSALRLWSDYQRLLNFTYLFACSFSALCLTSYSNHCIFEYNFKRPAIMEALKEYLPWTTTPLIVNAPMAAPPASAGPALATAVSEAGGLGLIGGRFSMDDLRTQLQAASKTLNASTNPTIASAKLLPLGVGFLTFVLNLDDVLPVIEEFKPTVVWLFVAKELDGYKVWTDAIRDVSPASKIWIQTGSVTAALHIAKTAKPDAICMQGTDAGGHGFEKGASIVTLLPETVDAFEKEGLSDIPLLASGGIMDGRGVAAALALGASGVVMGTRFLGSVEIEIHPQYQAAVLEGRDGGQITTRSHLFDELSGPNMWPEAYDGRSLAMQSVQDQRNGVALEEIQRLHNEAVKKEDGGFSTALKGRATIWAGTGLGLVNEIESARQIVESVRKEAEGVLKRVSKF
jgi:nitronate monooxygenase